MAAIEYELRQDLGRIDGINLDELGQKDIQFNSIIKVMGYVYGKSGSEYHFCIGLDPRLPGISVFCDDSSRYGSQEYYDMMRRFSSIVNSEIDPATGDGNFHTQNKRSLIEVLNSIFDEFDEREYRNVVVDYKK